jgi:hypothetical protein
MEASFNIYEEKVAEFFATGFHSDVESNNKCMNVAPGVSTTVPGEGCLSKKSRGHTSGSYSPGDRPDSVSFFLYSIGNAPFSNVVP